MVAGFVTMLAVTFLRWTASRVSPIASIRTLHGLTFGVTGTALGAIAADSLPTSRMAEGLGYFGLTATLSMGIAPLIGIWIVRAFGHQVLFAVVSSMTLVTLLSSLGIEGPGTTGVPGRTSVAVTLSNLFEKAALLPSVVMFFLSLVNGSIVYFIVLYATSLV
jgi:hypothetical protein